MVVNINKNNFKVKLAVSDKERAEGMMHKRFDETFNGLLFMQNEGEHCYWMKNCIIPLDIIYINNNIITKIHHNCLPSKDVNHKRYCGYGDMVLEILGGKSKELKISVGDKLGFKF